IAEPQPGHDGPEQRSRKRHPEESDGNPEQLAVCAESYRLAAGDRPTRGQPAADAGEGEIQRNDQADRGSARERKSRRPRETGVGRPAVRHVPAGLAGAAPASARRASIVAFSWSYGGTAA